MSYSTRVIRVSQVLIVGIQVQVPVQVEPRNTPKPCSQLIKNKSPSFHISLLKVLNVMIEFYDFLIESAINQHVAQPFYG